MNEQTTEALPHEAYMNAVARALDAHGIAPRERWAGTFGGKHLVASFGGWPREAADAAYWPHGVLLTWDQAGGWALVEDNEGGARWQLSEDSRVYCDPRQVAADTRARLSHGRDGWTPGPICIDGPRWDTRGTQNAVQAWAQR